jgi:hypothetical protein
MDTFDEKKPGCKISRYCTFKHQSTGPFGRFFIYHPDVFLYYRSALNIFTWKHRVDTNNEFFRLWYFWLTYHKDHKEIAEALS